MGDCPDCGRRIAETADIRACSCGDDIDCDRCRSLCWRDFHAGGCPRPRADVVAELAPHAAKIVEWSQRWRDTTCSCFTDPHTFACAMSEIDREGGVLVDRYRNAKPKETKT